MCDSRADDRCGLRGIAARIHCASASAARRPSAVACGESPLGYTAATAHRGCHMAVACGESPLGYTTASGQPRQPIGCGLRGIAARIHCSSRYAATDRTAVACGESSLGYTLEPTMLRRSIAVACGESPLGYTCRSDLHCRRISCGLRGIAARIHCSCGAIPTTWRAVACGESPLGYTLTARFACSCRVAVACGESPLGYTASGVNDLPARPLAATGARKGQVGGEVLRVVLLSSPM